MSESVIVIIVSAVFAAAFLTGFVVVFTKPRKQYRRPTGRTGGTSGDDDDGPVIPTA